MQVYKDLDIGSAKPTLDYVKKIPHHLISIIDPSKQFSVADFVSLADKAVSEIYNRGKIPVISGGTAFYFKNFIYGLPELPTVCPEIRDKVQLMLKEDGINGLYSQLKELDSSAAMEINPGDTYRVTRALEIFLQTGRSILSFKLPEIPREKYNFLIIGLEREREELYNRIDKRVDIMFNDGMINEFKALYKRDMSPESPGMRGIGYSEFFQMMISGCWNREDLKNEIRRNSRRYAKRQITFFKSFSNVHWFNPECKKELKALVEEFLFKSS